MVYSRGIFRDEYNPNESLKNMCRALIIDDEDAICRVIVYALSRSGIETDVATNGFDGIRKFDQEAFDVVITDILMPGTNGNEVARHVRRSNRPETPVIGMSGTVWAADGGAFDAVLEKPFSIHKLLAAVKSLTDTVPSKAAVGA